MTDKPLPFTAKSLAETPPPGLPRWSDEEWFSRLGNIVNEVMDLEDAIDKLIDEMVDRVAPTSEFDDDHRRELKRLYLVPWQPVIDALCRAAGLSEPGDRSTNEIK
jgi:hypothetical protein